MDRKSFLKRLAIGVGAVAVGAEVPKFIEPPAEPVAAPALNLMELSAVSYPLQSPLAIEIGFREALRGKQHAYPLLYQAVQNMSRANNTNVEWRRKYQAESNLTQPFGLRYPQQEFNHMQIFRTPFSYSGTQLSRKSDVNKLLIKLRNEALDRHLTTIEQALRNGTRRRWSESGYSEGALPYSIRQGQTMGGIKNFKAGTPKLRVLRDLALLTNRQANDFDGYMEEFLSEVTLEVS